jgi:hypothetical protein
MKKYKINKKQGQLSPNPLKKDERGPLSLLRIISFLGLSFCSGLCFSLSLSLRVQKTVNVHILVTSAAVVKTYSL